MASQRAPRAEALCWSAWGISELHPYMMQYLYHGLDTPRVVQAGHRSKATATKHGQLRRLLDALDARLEGREHLLGAFSLADISSAEVLISGVGLGVSLEGRANVERWLDRCRARPALARAA